MSAAACPRCQRPLPPGSAFCPFCGGPVSAAGPAPPAPAPPAPAPPAPALARTCVNCQSRMQRTGELAFRVGGYVGGHATLIGASGEFPEGLQPFAVYYCPRCGKVDLYYPGT